MNILLSGYHNPNFVTITEYLEDAIQENGHNCIAFDDRQFILPGRIRDKIRFLDDFDHQRLNKSFYKLAQAHRPDICLVTGGHRIYGETIRHIKDLGITTALWTIDAPTNFQPIIDAAGEYDYIFCGGSEAVEILESHGLRNVQFLPFACVPHKHHFVQLNEDERRQYGHDVVFVGSYYSNRCDVLEQLLEFDLSIWGPGWNQVSLKHPLRKAIRGENLQPEEWRKIYSAAKIVIVVHYQDQKTPCYQASPKVYEVLACRGFLLVDQQKDVLSLFSHPQHLVAFDTIDDLKGKIQYYLTHQDQRRSVAASGQEEVLARHTYHHRIQKLLATISREDEKN